MVPIFALSLSFEGIVLLRHMDGVWAKIAEVALDAPDLEAEVIGLREQALALDPEGAKVALIIPNEQIRYLDAPIPAAMPRRVMLRSGRRWMARRPMRSMNWPMTMRSIVDAC